MKIHLLSLSLTNFKGLRKFDVKFFNDVTNIFGRNEAGKTSLFDAFLWLLFGKDSADRADFSIKTLDEKNEPFHRQDHQVEGLLMVDGSEVTLRRLLTEKWTTKKGTTKPEFTGHETAFFYNDVPQSKKDYESKVNDLLKEGLFRLLTNTNYFNALPWQERRGILTAIAGQINDADIAGSNPAFLSLLTAIRGKKTMAEYLKEVVAAKKLIKDKMDMLPTRINEANLAVPEDKDWDAIQANINALQVSIDGLDGLINNKSKAEQEHQKLITGLLTQKQKISRLMLNIEFDAKTKVQSAGNDRITKINAEKSSLSLKQTEKSQKGSDYSAAVKQQNALLAEQEELKTKYTAIEAEKIGEFKEGEFCCPTCKRLMENVNIEEKKQEFIKNFNTSKSNRLTAITTRNNEISTLLSDYKTKVDNIVADGQKVAGEITVIESRIENLVKEHTRLNEQATEELAKELEVNTTYQKCIVDLNDLQEKIDAPHVAEDNSELISRKKMLLGQQDVAKKELAAKETRITQLARVTELEQQETTLATEYANYEGIEHNILMFEKARMSELEHRINNRFKIVTFKMFQSNINGGEEPCCITLVKGVPYPDVNTAGRAQAGLDIINTLSEHYGVQAPVWVDNRESVTALPDTECQLINLLVSPTDKTLRVGAVENVAMELA